MVRFRSRARASLAPIGDDPGFTGEIERSFTWTFDATAGRLVSLSSDQTTEGRADLGRGEISVALEAARPDFRGGERVEVRGSFRDDGSFAGALLAERESE